MDDTLVTRLRAHLDEVEQQARAATFGGEWAMYGSTEFGVEEVNSGHTVVEAPRCEDHDDNRRADVEFIARWDPTTVLRLVERDRALLAAWEAAEWKQWSDMDGCEEGMEFAIKLAASFWLGEDSTDG